MSVIERVWVCGSHRPHVDPVVVYDQTSADWYAERGWMVREFVPSAISTAAVEAIDEALDDLRDFGRDASGPILHARQVLKGALDVYKDGES